MCTEWIRHAKRYLTRLLLWTAASLVIGLSSALAQNTLWSCKISGQQIECRSDTYDVTKLNKSAQQALALLKRDGCEVTGFKASGNEEQSIVSAGYNCYRDASSKSSLKEIS